MSEADIKPLNAKGLQSPAAAFATFCKEERERRASSGESFDEDRFDEAMELALKKLKVLEGEDLQ